MSSSNTETRILQMQLENKDFEEGVRQTIKSLESLEEKLDLKNAGDGFEKVSAAANSVQMSHLESGLDSVTNKFTLMGQIGLQVLERISSRVIDAGEKILRAATIQPMIDGWGEFEMKTNSVQTILGGIRKDFDDQPSAINAISEALDELNEYADKTIYNFAQMTENVGKFTNQGLKLEDSTNAIKGIANWAAAVGANPQQMSRAMYNISQSLGAGSMQLIDWRSIRFANMATPEVKKLFAEVAKKQGLIGQDGMVQISKKQKVNVLEDFESSLKAKWLTNDVMAEAFGIYANAFSEEELIAKYGEKLGREFYEMGVYAEQAATKVRTFSQLLGVLQESLGSGWANTFDILFGGFEQQTEFLTAIKERLEEIINFQTDDRNTWLQNFSDIGGIVVFQDVILKTIDILSDFYWVFNDVAALVLNPFGKSVFNMSDGIFGPRQEGYTELRSTWEGVKEVFDDISNTLTNFRNWLYTPNEKSGRSPIHNLASALSGVAGVAGIAWQVLSNFGKMVFRLFKRFAPLVSAVLDLLGQIGGAIYNVFFNLTGQQTIEKVFDKIESAIGPIVDIVVGLSTAVVNLIHNLLGVDDAADDWTVLGDRMQAFWDIFQYDQNMSFADNLKNSLKNALIAIFGSDTAQSLIKAWDENIAPVLEQISGFVQQAFGDLNRVLDGLMKASEADYSKADGVMGKGKTFLNAFLAGYYGEDMKSAEEAYTNILGIYQEIKQYYDEHVSPYVDQLMDIFTVQLPALNTTISNFLFGHEIIGKQGNTWREGGLLQTIQEFFRPENLEDVVVSIQTFLDPVFAAITDAYRNVHDFLFGQETTVMTGPGQSYSYRSGGLFQAVEAFFSPENLKGIISSIQAFIDPIIQTITDTYQKVYDFLFGQEITVMTGPGQSFSYRSGGIFQAVEKFFNPENLEGIVSTIQTFFDPIIKAFNDACQKVYDFLFGKDVEVLDNGHWRQGHQNGLFEIIQTYFSGETWKENWAIIENSFTEVSKWITENGSAAWNTIMDFLFGPETVDDKGVTQRSGGAYEAAIAFLTPVWDWIQETGDKLYNYIAEHNFEEMWQGLKELLFGYDTIVMTGAGQSFSYHTDGLLTPIVEMLRPIAEAFEQAKGWALEKIGSIDWGSIWESVSKFFGGYDEVVTVHGGQANSSQSVSSVLVHHEGVFEKIMNFFDRIVTYFQSPEFQEFIGNVKTFYHTYIEPIFTWLNGLGGELWGAIQGLFSGQGLGALSGVGDYISQGINSLLGNIFPEGFDLSGILGGLFGGGEGTTIIDQLFGSLFGEGGETQKTAEKAAEQASNQSLGSWILDLFIGKAGAEEQTAESIADTAAGVVATLDQTASDVNNATDKGAKASNSILEGVSKILPYVGGAAAVGLVSKVSDMITGITGNRKPTILEQISGLIRSFGEAFQGLGIMIAATGFAEWVSPGALDKVFGHVKTLLDTIFGWIADIVGGGSALTGLINLVGKAAFGKNASLIDSPVSMISSLGQGLESMFNALDTLFDLTLKVMAADFFMDEKLPDGSVVHHFDERMQRVLGFVEQVTKAIVFNWGTGAALIGGLAETWVEAAAASKAVKAGVKDFSAGGSIAQIFMGIASMASGILDGVAAIMTASIIPGTLNFDTSKITDIINAVFAGITALMATTDILAAINALEASSKTTGIAKAGEIADVAILDTLFGSLGLIAGALFDWYMNIVNKHMIAMAPTIYTFITNLAGALQALSSIGNVELSSAESFLTESLPRILGEMTSDDIGFDKAKINERGSAIRDFGNRVSAGINSLAKAKDVFDKYNTGKDDFPLNFFQEMTEALQYLNGDGFQELYDSVFGFEGFIADSNDRSMEEKINDLKSFFSTMGMLGSVVVQTNEGGELVTVKDGLDAFQDAFSGIKDSFHSLIGDISEEGFDTNKINALGDFLQKIAQAGETFSKPFHYVLGDEEGYSLLSPITSFAGFLQSMGTSIRQLNDSLKVDGEYDIDYTQLESALGALGPLADLEQKIYEYALVEKTGFTIGRTGIISTEQWQLTSRTLLWLEEVMPQMKEIGTHLHEMAAEIKPEDVAALTSASGTLSSLANFMASDLYTNIQIMGTDQIGGYATAFNELKQSLLMPENGGNTIASTIQEIINATGDKEIQLKITPILDDSNLGGNLPDGLSMENTYSRMITMQMNMNDVQNVRIEAAQIQSLVEANNATRTEIATLANAISRIQINVNAPAPVSGPRNRVIGVYPLVANYQSPYDEP